MSERGSFVTQYIYCSKCLEAAKKVLLRKEKYLCSQLIDNWDSTGKPIRIVAGKVGGLYAGEELDAFTRWYCPLLAKLICHSLRIAVLAENGERIYRLEPVFDSHEKRNGDL